MVSVVSVAALGGDLRAARVAVKAYRWRAARVLLARTAAVPAVAVRAITGPPLAIEAPASYVRTASQAPATHAAGG